MIFPRHIIGPPKTKPPVAENLIFGDGEPVAQADLTAIAAHRWARRRGRMGLRFWAGVSGCSLHRVMREMARACHRLGYDVSVGLSDTNNPHVWPSTSIAHLLGEPRLPYVDIMYGVGQREPGMALASFGVADDWRWNKPEAVADINAWADFLCVPAPSNLVDYAASGVTVPLEVVPYGVDTGVYRPWGRDEALIAGCEWGGRLPAPGARLFLVAGYLQGRKNVAAILAAFNAAFQPTDNVAMIVKTVAKGTSQLRWGKPQGIVVEQHRQALPIGYCDADLDDWTMARLLSMTTLVSTPFREGFGLMPLEAMACGSPPICLNHDGPSSYATDANCLLVEPTGSGHPGEAWPDIPQAAGPRCAVVSQDSLVDAFRRAAAGDADGLREGALATAAAWTWEAAAQGLVAAVERHVGPVRRLDGTVKFPLSEQPPYEGPIPGIVAAVEHYEESKRRERESLTRMYAAHPCVLIPARNPGTILAEEVADLRATEYPSGVEIVIFDDASADSVTVAVKGARVIRSEAHVGEGAARMFLLEQTDAEWVCFTDSDVRFPDPLWARKLIEFIGDRNIVACPLLLDPEGKVWSAGGTYRDYGDPLGWLPAWHRHANEDPSDWPAREVPYAPTACWFARRETLLGLDWIGGYFPTVFADVELAFQLRARGVEFWFAPVATMVHHHGSFTEATAKAEQEARFAAHARTFVSRWSDRIAHDLAVEAAIGRREGGLEGTEQSDHGGSAEEGS